MAFNGQDRMAGMTFEMLRLWSTDLLQNCVRVWPTQLAQRLPCEVDDCHHKAVSQCAICGEPTCLAHAFVQSTAKIVCSSCVEDARPTRPKKAKKRLPREEPPPHPRQAPPPPRPPPSWWDASSAQPASDPRRVFAFTVMGLPESATQAEIGARYRELARQYHPDRNPGDPTAASRFDEVTKAYQVLKV